MRRYDKIWSFPFLGTCAWLKVTHGLARAYGYRRVGGLMGLFVFSHVMIAVGSFFAFHCSILLPKSPLYMSLLLFSMHFTCFQVVILVNFFYTLSILGSIFCFQVLHQIHTRIHKFYLERFQFVVVTIIFHLNSLNEEKKRLKCILLSFILMMMSICYLLL